MALTLLIHVAAPLLVETTYTYDEVAMAEGAVEAVRTYDPQTGRIEAGVVDVQLDQPTFLGARTRRQIPAGDHRAQLIDRTEAGDRVLADGVVRRSEVGHDDPGSDPARPLARWTVRIADRALSTLEAALADLDLAQPGVAESLISAGGTRRLRTGTAYGDGTTDVAPLVWCDLSRLARLAVERSGATVLSWPTRLASLTAAIVGSAATVERGGRLYVRRPDAVDDVEAVPSWTGADAVAAASAYRRLVLRARYAPFPSVGIVASLVAPASVPSAGPTAGPSGLLALDGAVPRPWAEDGEAAGSDVVSVGFERPSVEVQPSDTFVWPAGWLRASNTGQETDSLTVGAGVQLTPVAVERVETVTIGDYSEDVAIGPPVAYSDETAVLACVVEPAVSGELAVAYRVLPGAGRRHELAAVHWFGAHADRASEADTAALTLDLDDAAAAGLDAARVAPGDVVAWDGDAWIVTDVVRRHDEGQLDVDLWRPYAIVRGQAPIWSRATAPPRLSASIERTVDADGRPTDEGRVAVARPRPGVLGDGTDADAPDRYVIEVSLPVEPPVWSASTGTEPVVDDQDHRQFRARAEYDAEGVVTAYTVASTDPAA